MIDRPTGAAVLVEQFNGVHARPGVLTVNVVIIAAGACTGTLLSTTR